MHQQISPAPSDSNVHLFVAPAPAASPIDEVIPSSEQLIAHIDAEIEQQRSIEAAGGWTSWAIITALVTVAVLFVQTWETARVDPYRVALWVLTFFLMADSVVALFLPGGSAQFKLPNQIRTRRAQFYAARRPMFVAQLIRSLILVIIAFVTSKMHQYEELRAVHSMVTALYTLNVFKIVLWLWPDRAEARRPDWTGRGHGIGVVGGLVRLFFLLMAFGSVPVFIEVLGVPTPGQSIPADLRMGALICMFTYLLLWLADVTHRPPIINHLLDLRRALVLGKISIATAAQEVEEAVRGGPTWDEVLKEQSDSNVTRLLNI